MQARGTFTVKTAPQPPDPAHTESQIGHFLLDKQYEGDLEGSAFGQMLGAGNPATGSAGYVAIERVTGRIEGRSGSFTLLHRGVMSSGALELLVTVIPGSGTGDLEGIDGTLTIEAKEGQHHYAFDYSLAATKP
jgi:hypothetical protein